MHNQAFIDEMKQKLLETKDRLAAELAGLSSHTEVGTEEDENATELEIDEASQDVMATIASDLQKIDAALARIENGTYGVDSQGKEISERRLRVLPWADTAI